MKKVILIDIDDTLWDLLTPWIDCLNKAHNLDINVCDCQGWDMEGLFPTLTKEQIYEPLHGDSFWNGVKPINGAQEYVKRLLDEGYDIRICTATSYRGCKGKIEHFLSLFPFIDPHNIIMCYDKQLINGFILVDDYVGNLRGGNYHKILFSAYHNHNEDSTGMIRVNNWKECYEQITKLYEEEQV